MTADGKTWIFHALDGAAWRAAQAAGTYHGSETDQQDGFIHFSDAGQITGSVARYHADKVDLVLLKVRAADLGDALKWEASRHGNLYPHLYGALPVARVTQAITLENDGRGGHILPAEFLGDKPA